MMRNRGLKTTIEFSCYRFFFSLFFTGTQMSSGSQRKQCTTTIRGTTASASLLDTPSRRTTTAGGSLKNKDPSKDTSIPKEIQAQGILKPRMSVSKSMCNTKTSSRVLLEENVHRQNQLLKSKVQILLCLLGIWFQ